MSASGCIGEPISWLRLEQFALAGAAARDAAVGEHVARCAACAHCLDEIRGDLVALPPLAVPEAASARPGWLRGLRGAWAPAFAVAAAAVVALVVWRGGTGTGEHEPGEHEPGEHEPGAPRPDEIARVKGVGDVVLGTVRERAGAIRDGVRTYAPGDRWKLVVTCPPAAGAAPLAVEVAVFDAGAVDHPLPPTELRCGNRVALPGAFSITGDRANRVCVRITGDRALAPPAVACLELTPE